MSKDFRGAKRLPWRCGLGWAQGRMCYLGVHIGATWRIQLNRPCATVMQPFCHMTFWPFVLVLTYSAALQYYIRKCGLLLPTE